MTNSKNGKSTLFLDGLEVFVTKKNIKNIHLSIVPPAGIIRLSAPKNTSDENIKQLVLSKLSWIRDKQIEFYKQPRVKSLCFNDGEIHYYLGKVYKLKNLIRECELIKFYL